MLFCVYFGRPIHINPHGLFADGGGVDVVILLVGLSAEGDCIGFLLG